MADNGFKVKNKLSIKPSTTAGDTEGDIRVDGSGNLKLRDGAGEKTVLDEDNSVTVSNKTLTSPVLNGTLSGTAFLDEDTMTSDSNIAAASQQSIKAYVDTEVGTATSSLTTHIADTTTHGTTGDIVGTSDSQVLSNKSTSDDFTVGGQLLVPTGTAAAPSMTFTGDSDTGFFNGSDNINVSLGGTKGAAFTKSVGGLTNFGIGLYSTSDSIPFYLLRSHSSSTSIAVVNQNSGAGANVSVAMETDTASATKAQLALYSTSSSLTSLAGRMAVRSRNGNGVSICSEDTGGDIRFYIEGFYAADEYQRFTKENVTFDGGGTISVDASLAFEVTGTTTRAAKPAPTLTQTQRDAISSPAAGSFAYNSDTNKYNYYNGSGWSDLDTSVTGIKNYFTNGDFETGIGLATVYDDGAGAYVDGSGGSPTTITIAQNSTTPLRDTNDLKITKAATDGSGEGVTLLSETIERADQDSTVYFECEYDFSHANYTAGDVSIEVYDVVGAATLTVKPLQGLDSTGAFEKVKGKAVAMITTTSSTTGAIRVSLHLASDSATASTWDAYIDDAVLAASGTDLVEINDDPFTYPAWVATTWLNVSSFTLTPGTWDVDVLAAYRTSSGAAPGAISDIHTHIHTTSAAAGTLNYGDNAAVGAVPNVTQHSISNSFCTTITLTATTTYYLNHKLDITPAASSVRLDYYKVRARKITKES